MSTSNPGELGAGPIWSLKIQDSRYKMANGRDKRQDGRWNMENGVGCVMLCGVWCLVSCVVCGVWRVVVCGSRRKCTEPVTPNVLRSTVADYYLYIYIYCYWSGPVHIHTYVTIYVCEYGHNLTIKM